MNNTVNTLLITVVVGNATPFASKEDHRVIALAVPSSLILNINLSKLFGVPVRLVVIEVIAVASAVIVTASQLSVLIVGVALLVILVTLGTILLLVSVSVQASVAKSLSDNAALNCAVVPLSVLLERLIVLLVRVCVPVRVTKSDKTSVVQLITPAVELIKNWLLDVGAVAGNV